MTNIQRHLATLPANPGVYIFKDAQGQVLYIGKAKSLRSRVRSYFSRPAGQPVSWSADLDPAKREMVKEIADLQTITTDNETEALILEANLIRQHQPPYNVVLRDDKYYLFIKITTNEPWPRVFLTRKIKRDNARYFGPYSSARSVRSTLRLLRRIFPYRGEKESPREKIFPHPLFASSGISKTGVVSPERVRAASGHGSPSTDGQSDPQILQPRALGGAKKARGYTTLAQQQYLTNIQNIIRFLSGHRDDIIRTLQAGMKQAAAAKQYERAAIFRDQLEAIERLEGSQKVYLPRRESFDVISLARSHNTSAVNVFAVRGGKLLGKNTFLLRHRGAATVNDVVRQFLLQYYGVAQDVPKVILVPIMLDDAGTIAQWINHDTPPIFHVPKRGKKKRLLALGQVNAEQLIAEQEARFASRARLHQAAADLARAIGARSPLARVEIYDVSNIQGTLATAAMVVFADGQPQPSKYRKFRIRFGQTPNDVAMLQETLRRRFAQRHREPPSDKTSSLAKASTYAAASVNKSVDQRWPMPDLIVIDGGKGQLSAASKVLTELNVTAPVIAIAKQEEEIFVPGRATAIRLPHNADALHLLQRMRDEAHRFTIAYHRHLRSQRQRRSQLDEVPGIGPATKKKLLRHFGSLQKIRTASDEELARIIGRAKTRALRDYL